jgi:hypothetical protein
MGYLNRFLGCHGRIPLVEMWHSRFDHHQRTALPMNRLAYLLILLLITAQVDNYWPGAPLVPSAPQADDDEYLPLPQRPKQQECSPHQKPVFAGREAQAPDLPLVRTGVPSGQSLTTPFAPSPLYVFMSFQL